MRLLLAFALLLPRDDVACAHVFVVVGRETARLGLFLVQVLRFLVEVLLAVLLRLRFVDAAVFLATLEQFRVRALVEDAAFVHDDDLVGFLDGRDALRDDDLRGVRDLVVERFADELVRLGVHR